MFSWPIPWARARAGAAELEFGLALGSKRPVSPTHGEGRDEDARQRERHEATGVPHDDRRRCGGGHGRGIPGILLAQKPPSFPKGTKLHLLEYVSFIPAADVELKRQGEEFGKLAGVDVTVELINYNDLNPRIASAIENKAGPDIIQMHQNWPHLYADGLADVDSLAEEIDRRDGGIYEMFRNVSVRRRALEGGAHGHVHRDLFAYRTDWFQEAGATKFPDTMDELRKVGTELKKKDRPMGQAFGHSLGDPNGWAYGVTWCFGGQEVDKEQKRVLINSKETIEAIKFTVAMWKDALDEGGWPGTTPATTAPTMPGRSRPRSTVPASTSWPSDSSLTSRR